MIYNMFLMCIQFGNLQKTNISKLLSILKVWDFDGKRERSNVLAKDDNEKKVRSRATVLANITASLLGSLMVQTSNFKR